MIESEKIKTMYKDSQEEHELREIDMTYCTCLDYTMVGGKAICQRCNKEKIHPDIEIFKGAYIERNDAYNKSKEEVERLMVLLEKMVYSVWSYLPYKGNMSKTQYWEDFKKENNITPV